jgi:CDGSH-type Zn-finger protein
MSTPPDRSEPEIHVEEDGPYVVRGPLPIARTRKVKTEFGEPIDYAPLEPIEAGTTYRLCRCGRSETKPFCDDSHLDEPRVDVQEAADHGQRSERTDVFQNTQVGAVITDDLSLCSKAGYCKDRFTGVWQMLGSSDPAVRERMQRMVELCPSGRLAWGPSEDAPEHEPAYDPEIAVFRNGPYFVRGGVRVVGADGEPYEVRNRQALCRCGHSQNKPFCDGSHSIVGFRDG